MSQQIIPQDIGRRGVADLFQVRRLAQQEPESPADAGGRGTVFDHLLKDAKELFDAVWPIGKHLGGR